jgi:hypothetical protein
MATPAQRQHLHALMGWLEAHEPQIHYAQVRPMRTRVLREQQLADVLAADEGSVTMDCSEAVTLLCRLAGLKDPNGQSYNGSGFTGTLLRTLPHYSAPKAADVGALVVYGAGSGEHVSMVYEPSADPVLWSHGTEGGPLFIPLSEQRKLHAKPVTFLSVARL